MEANFTQIPNEILDNKNLTLEQKAVLAIFYRNSSEWKVYQKELESRSKNGRDKHVNILNELKGLGFIEKVIEGSKRNSSTGKFCKEDIYWRLVNTTVNWNPVTGNQQRETSNPLAVTNNTNQTIQKNKTNINKSVSVGGGEIEGFKTETDFSSNQIEMVEVEIPIQEKVEQLVKTETDFSINQFEGVQVMAQPSISKQVAAKKNDWFFDRGEKPGFQRLEEFFNKKGYSSKQALEFHKRLIDSNYKDSKGDSINYFDSYINKELQKLKPELINDEIETLIKDVYTAVLSNIEDKDEQYRRTLQTKIDAKEFVQELNSKFNSRQTTKFINFLINFANRNEEIKSVGQLRKKLYEDLKYNEERQKTKKQI